MDNIIDKNNVSAKGQMVNSSYISFLGNADAKTKILIVGNSITRHGPKADIGWDRDWGMAASAPEKDYVHRLYAMLNEAGYDVLMRISQCANWEITFAKTDDLSPYDGDREFDADIVVFCLGENVKEPDRPNFKEPLKKFINHICPTGKVLFTTCFWECKVIDDIIKEVALERGETCLDRGFAKDGKNMATGQYWHEGVAWHPSDAGMECIASAIFEQLKKEMQ